MEPEFSINSITFLFVPAREKTMVHYELLELRPNKAGAMLAGSGAFEGMILVIIPTFV